ncbi:MAG: hypothetical protein ACTS6A_02690 [Candidatus Hodgkinia cicadicola]
MVAKSKLSAHLHLNMLPERLKDARSPPKGGEASSDRWSFGRFTSLIYSEV